MNVQPQSDMACGCPVHRRGFLSAIAGGAAMAAGGGGTANAAARDIVDVHAHYLSPESKAAMGSAAGPMGAWSVQQHLDEMGKAGVSRSLLSVTTPGIVATGAEGAKLVRSANEYGAKLTADYPGKFGFFVYVQNPGDTQAALAEIAYGLDTLKAQGIGLFTSYNSKYLGDPAFDPVFAELERRKAIVYIHPNGPSCCTRILPVIPDTAIEFGTDTTRAIANYIYRGAARKYPNVKMIWSHSGGTMPYLIERFDVVDRAPKPEAPQGFRVEASKFFYDVAQASNPAATSALRKVVPMGQIVFGTDYPFRTMSEHVAQLESGKVFKGADLTALYRGNVVKALPGLMA
jgi:6-methylsalicylate decarboxylase